MDYNERLFNSSRWRRRYHLARYEWVGSMFAGTSEPLRILEIGCHDAKTIEHIGAPIEHYLGVCAGWDDGLNIARKRYADRPEVEFIETIRPSSLADLPDKSFNVAIALETLEHIEVPVMRAYLAEMARLTRGLLLVSVPNEMGPVFLAKHVAKSLRYKDADPYTLREVFWATMCRPDKVQRVFPGGHVGHKGFDYRELVEDIAEHFEIREVRAIVPRRAPVTLALTVGIVAAAR